MTIKNNNLFFYFGILALNFPILAMENIHYDTHHDEMAYLHENEFQELSAEEQWESWKEIAPSFMSSGRLDIEKKDLRLNKKVLYFLNVMRKYVKTMQFKNSSKVSHKKKTILNNIKTISMLLSKKIDGINIIEFIAFHENFLWPHISFEDTIKNIKARKPNGHEIDWNNILHFPALLISPALLAPNERSLDCTPLSRFIDGAFMKTARMKPILLRTTLEIELDGIIKSHKLGSNKEPHYTFWSFTDYNQASIYRFFRHDILHWLNASYAEPKILGLTTYLDEIYGVYEVAEGRTKCFLESALFLFTHELDNVVNIFDDVDSTKKLIKSAQSHMYEIISNATRKKTNQITSYQKAYLDYEQFLAPLEIKSNKTVWQKLNNQQKQEKIADGFYIFWSEIMDEVEGVLSQKKRKL